MQLFDLLYHTSNILSKEECQLFVNEFEKQKIRAGIEGSNNAIDGKRYNSNFKVLELLPSNQYYDIAINKMENALQLWFNHLETFNSFYTSELKNRLKFPHKVRLLKYGEGQYIHPHIDHEDFTYASVVLNLNDDYEGGEFCFFNKKHKVHLKQGDAIIFPADCFWVHEVLPVTRGARYSINSFIKNIPWNKYTELRDTYLTQIHDQPLFNLK